MSDQNTLWHRWEILIQFCFTCNILSLIFKFFESSIFDFWLEAFFFSNFEFRFSNFSCGHLFLSRFDFRFSIFGSILDLGFAFSDSQFLNRADITIFHSVNFRFSFIIVFTQILREARRKLYSGLEKDSESDLEHEFKKNTFFFNLKTYFKY